MTETRLLSDDLRRVLRGLPSPVGLVTCVHDGVPVGLAVSAIMPVSLDPCAMAIAINRANASHAPLTRSGQFCINFLDAGLTEHLAPFASWEQRHRRFTLPGWAECELGWFIEDAPANIFCTIRSMTSFGTHDVVIGEVTDVRSVGVVDMLGWSNGRFSVARQLDMPQSAAGRG